MNSSWILGKASPVRANIDLYCFPYAGGGSTAYLSWATVLGSDIGVRPVQPPGRENRLAETPCGNVTELVGACIQALSEELQHPYALFGHSMGALVAFELAREIRRRGLPSPRALLVSAKRAPHLPEKFPPIADLPDDLMLQALNQRYGLSIDPQWRELLELLMPTIRADIKAVEQYDYVDEPPFDFPIIAIGGREDRAVTVADIEPWRFHTSSDFCLHMLDAGHFYPPEVQRALCDLIREELKK